MGEELKLLRTKSPVSLRIVWALKLKGLEYDTVYVNQANKSSLISELNPIHKINKVPVLLVHGGKEIAEPLVILEYIDEVWKQNPLLPQDPCDRAVARFWAKFAEDKVVPSIKKAFEGNEKEEGKEEAMENWKHLEEELKGKRFFGGEAIGFVDIVVGWVAYSFDVLEEQIGPHLITEERFPLLSKWIREFSTTPIISENWPSAEQLLIDYRAMHQIKSQALYQTEYYGYDQIESQIPYQTKCETLHQTEYHGYDQTEFQDPHQTQY